MAKRLREKAKSRSAAKDTRPSATARYIRISPSKARVVMSAVRGKSVPEAIAILENTPKAASEVLLKVVNSAVANAENNMNLSRHDLVVAECYANEGPTLKRIMPRAQGRAFRINKRTSHITVILDSVNA